MPWPSCFYTPQANGSTNELRVDVLHGNIFDPQLGILGSNVSNNSTTGNGAIGTSNSPLINNPIVNNPITQLLVSLWNTEIVFGPAGAGPINNTTQISFLSFNIFNPQAGIFGGNLSHNTTNGNVAVGYGNNSNTSVTSVPNLWTSWFGGMTGNGNVFQLAFLSGNIFNPQWSLFGPNVSNNTAITNVPAYNGNYSQTSVIQGGGLLGAVARLFFGGTTGNGNTTQTAVNASNIENTQLSIGSVGHTPNPEPASNPAPASTSNTTSTSTASTGTPTSGSTGATTANTVSANSGSYSASFSPTDTVSHSVTAPSGSPAPQTGGSSGGSAGSGATGNP
jgi:hypothetical protein